VATRRSKSRALVLVSWPDRRAEETIYYVDSSRLLPTGPAPMMRWRKRLFSFMARNASAATDFFSIPPNRVVELGARFEF